MHGNIELSFEKTKFEVDNTFCIIIKNIYVYRERNQNYISPYNSYLKIKLNSTS